MCLNNFIQYYVPLSRRRLLSSVTLCRHERPQGERTRSKELLENVPQSAPGTGDIRGAFSKHHGDRLIRLNSGDAFFPELGESRSGDVFVPVPGTNPFLCGPKPPPEEVLVDSC